MSTKVFHVFEKSSKGFENKMNELIGYLESQGFEIHDIKYSECSDFFSALIITKFI
jgi:hypothetical protein